MQGMDTDAVERAVAQHREKDYISYEVMVDLINRLIDSLEDECLGLHLGEQISLRVTAYVDSIMQYSDSLEESFENAVKYSRLISDALDCSLQKEDKYYAVRFEENPNWKVQQSLAKRQILDLTLLSCLKSLIAYTQHKYYPIRIHFESPKPRDINEYYRVFNCSLHFNKSQTEIFFERSIFKKHTKSIEVGLLASLKRMVAYELQGLIREDELIYKLKKCILNKMPEHLHVREAARELNLSPRTLQRKLKALEASFTRIESELRLRMAMTYLEESQKSLDEISYLLGFSEGSAFIRFFKGQTSYTPTEFRRKKGETSDLKTIKDHIRSENL